MGLRPPTVGTTRTRATLRFRDHAAAAEVGELCGPRVVVSFEDGTSLTASLAAVGGSTLSIEGRSGDEASPPRPEPGDAVVVSWTELNDLASVQGEVEQCEHADWAVRCSWPPRREQRRAFRRFPLELPLWIVRTGDEPSAASEVLEATTRDVSGGGLALHLEAATLHAGEHVVVMLRAEDGDLVLPAAVHWLRPEQATVGLAFTGISQRDQDHLVRLVSLAEAARGR